MNDLTTCANVEQIVMMQEESFRNVCVDNKILFEKESMFAMQSLLKNDYLNKIAWNNKQSLQNAIMNVALLGISLNPASSHAYLVPRKGEICLDVSYRGLMHLATTGGNIDFIQCKIIKSNDEYRNAGIDAEPIHNYEAFGERGSVVGAVCIVKTKSGSYLTTEMNMEDIKNIMLRSESYKSGKASPWKSDFEEMAKKTVAKKAIKYLPDAPRLSSAIELSNNNGDGINFNEEKKREIRIENPIEEFKKLTSDRSPEKVLAWLKKGIGIDSLDELTEEMAEKAVIQIRKSI